MAVLNPATSSRTLSLDASCQPLYRIWVGLQGARGIMRRLSSEVFKAKFIH